jgi:hypothetical protein
MTDRRFLFVFRGTAAELLLLLAAQRHPAGKGLGR